MSGTNMAFLASVEGAPDRSLRASFRSISADYFRAMRVPLLRGRSFDDRDTASSPAVVVINESMARQIAPTGEAIGKRIKHGFKKQVAEVVGIVGDVKFAGLDKETMPEMYAPFAQRSWPFLRLVVRAKSDPLNLAAAIRGAAQSIDKDQPVDKISTMRSIVNSSIAPRRFYMQLLGSFAGMALILASIGIYGLVSYSVAQRTREIGIRMALGARRNDVLRLVLTEGFKLTIIGLVLGLVGAFAFTKVLRNLLFEVKPTDPFTFIVVSVSLLVVALLACYIPARRATKVDPLVALRYE
jgi:putative ABC transport system permease protein